MTPIKKGKRRDGMENGRPPLIEAVRRGDMEELENLVSAGEDLEERDWTEGTALCWAVLSGNIKAVEILLKAGASINSVVLSDCIVERSNECLFMLLEAGADPSSILGDGESSLSLALAVRNYEAAKILIEKGGKVLKAEGEGLLIGAARGGRLEEVRFLIECGADVESLDTYGRTPLFHAIKAGNREIAKFLMDKGARPEKRDFDGTTALVELTKSGERSASACEMMVELLIEYGLDVNARDASGDHLLIHAAKYKNLGVMSALIRGGADLDAKGGLHNKRALDVAVTMESESTVKLLLSAGANPNAGYTTPPLFQAIEKENSLIGMLLVEAGADPNSVWNGRTPLIMAVQERLPNLAIHLVRKGANLKDENMPVQAEEVARQNGDHDLADMLTALRENRELKGEAQTGQTAKKRKI